MDQIKFLDEAKQKMGRAIEVIKDDVATIRTGRATPSLVEDIIISAYDGTTKMKLSEMATITISDPRSLVISPFDYSQIEAIEKGIMESEVGLIPVVSEKVIRITIPSLTQERREEYIRLAKAKIEGGKVMIRQIRQEMMQQIKQAFEDKELNEDEKFRLEKKVQEIVDETSQKMEELGKKKEEELKKV